jgi:hypothetical protein
MAVHFREFVYIILELSEAMKVDGYRLMTIRQYQYQGFSQWGIPNGHHQFYYTGHDWMTGGTSTARWHC